MPSERAGMRRRMGIAREKSRGGQTIRYAAGSVGADPWDDHLQRTDLFPRPIHTARGFCVDGDGPVHLFRLQQKE